MHLTQLSLFLENKPGQLSIACRALAEAGIEIIALSLADTQQFGILRLVVEDHEKARQVLQNQGCVAKLTQVVAVEISDRMGGLAKVLEELEQTNINLEYMYQCAAACADKPLMIFRFEDAAQAAQTLDSKGFHVITRDELSRKLHQ